MSVKIFIATGKTVAGRDKPWNDKQCLAKKEGSVYSAAVL